MKGSLTLLGTGIKCVSHLTVEAQAYIQQSDLVLYLVNEPGISQWIQQNNPHSEDLSQIYFDSTQREKAYANISQYIVDTLKTTEKHISVAFYGHPTVFATPGLNAIRQAKSLGYPTYILPGISALDCLFADLVIDPGDFGCQSYEATDFFVLERQFDPRSHLVLWQIGGIGIQGHMKESDEKDRALRNLTIVKNYLLQFYPEQHQVVLYEASLYAHVPASIIPIKLAELDQSLPSKIATLYIPPLPNATDGADRLQILLS